MVVVEGMPLSRRCATVVNHSPTSLRSASCSSPNLSDLLGFFWPRPIWTSCSGISSRRYSLPPQSPAVPTGGLIGAMETLSGRFAWCSAPYGSCASTNVAWLARRRTSTLWVHVCHSPVDRFSFIRTETGASLPHRARAVWLPCSRNDVRAAVCGRRHTVSSRGSSGPSSASHCSTRPTWMAHAHPLRFPATCVHRRPTTPELRHRGARWFRRAVRFVSRAGPTPRGTPQPRAPR